MIRLLILISVGPMLLMPPGVCICRFAPAQVAAAEASENVTAARSQAGQAARPTDCCARKCRQAKPEKQSVPRETPRPADPADQPHPPGCPARMTTDAVKFIEAVEPVLDANLATSEPCELAIARPARPSYPLATNHSLDPPRYITFCTFLL